MYKRQPFRLYKRWTHEGGISTPLIVHWPAGKLEDGAIVREPFQLTDLLPTILDAAGVQFNQNANYEGIPECKGHSFLHSLRGEKSTDHTLYWEHTGNAAIRRGRWKLVREYPKPWELYDMETDRAETNDLALLQPNIVRELVAQWDTWARDVGVVPWEDVLDGYRAEGKSEAEAAG